MRPVGPLVKKGGRRDPELADLFELVVGTDIIVVVGDGGKSGGGRVVGYRRCAGSGVL